MGDATEAVTVHQTPLMASPASGSPFCQHTSATGEAARAGGGGASHTQEEQRGEEGDDGRQRKGDRTPRNAQRSGRQICCRVELQKEQKETRRFERLLSLAGEADLAALLQRQKRWQNLGPRPDFITP